MTAELYMFPGQGKRDPQVVLELAKKLNFAEVLVIGLDADKRVALCGSMESARDIAWLLKQGEWWLRTNHDKTGDE